MNQREVDVAIIGAGTAGMTAYEAALRHTDKLVLIEGAGYGTTCARVGCMPSKLLIAAADAARNVHEAGRFGIEVPGHAVDGRAVMRRVRMERDRFAGFVIDTVHSWPEEHRLHGMARFVSPHVLDVGGHTEVHARRIVIATGSSPVIPRGWREAAGNRVITSDDVFDLETLPASVAVVGAGAIGLEISLAFAQLGVRVRLLGRRGKIGQLTDPHVREKAREIVAAMLPFSPESEQVEVKRHGDAVTVGYAEAGAIRSESFDYLLVAAGRKPNLAELGLARAGVELGSHGVPKFNRHTGQVGGSHIFIAGDADADLPLLHEAADEGRVAGDNAGRFPDIRAYPRRAPLSIVFSEPQLVIAGQSHQALLEQGTRFEIGEASFDDQGRSRIMGRNRGVIRVYGEHGTGRFLGAEMIGPAAEHIGHLLAWTAQQGLTVAQMLDSPFYHPTVEEGVRTALYRLARRLRFDPLSVSHCLDCLS